MPRYCCLADVEALRRFRDLVQNKTATCNAPVKYIPWRDPAPGEPPPRNDVPVGMMPLHRFDADDDWQAERYFRKMQVEGCPSRWEIVGNAGTDAVPGSKPWRFRDGFHGARERLAAAAIPANAEGAVRSSPQYKAIGSLLGQVNDLYHRCRKEAGVAVMTPQERAGVANSLRRCEESLAVMAIMVHAGAHMIDPAYAALGIEHSRPYRLAIDEPPTEHHDPEPVTHPTRRPKQATAGAK